MIVKIRHHKIVIKLKLIFVIFISNREISKSFILIIILKFLINTNKFNFHKSYFRSSAQTRDIFNLMPMQVSVGRI
ncbi:unnamed protein product [Rhizophagus irregularis]|nr:unnamed protein product [Rhizophagus irregularis]